MRNVFMMSCAVFILTGMPVAAGLISSWEGTPDSAIDWDNKEAVDSATNMPSKYQYAAVGATDGTQSLKVIQSGWGQSLALDLNTAQKADFMANSIFKIDVSVAANDGTITEGYSQVYEVYMNAEGPGWTTVADETPVNFYWWPGSGERTQTLEIDYSAFRSAVTSTGYIQIVFALNTGGGAPAEIYFDNARLVPEPATLTLLGLGLLGLLRRKR